MNQDTYKDDGAKTEELKQLLDKADD